VGDVIFEIDSDNVLRQHVRYPFLNHSLPMKMALLDGIPRRKLAEPFVRWAQTPITFCGPSGTVPWRRAFDFLEPTLAPLLKGQLVFIGATYPRSADFLRTPYSYDNARSMYGVEILAQATHDIRSGLPRRPHESFDAFKQDFLFVFLLTLLVALAALRGTALGVTATLGGLAVATVCAVCSARDISPLWGFRFHPAAPFLLYHPVATGGKDSG
jgi:CHASE2 domain-containing sensor protein